MGHKLETKATEHVAMTVVGGGIAGLVAGAIFVMIVYLIFSIFENGWLALLVLVFLMMTTAIGVVVSFILKEDIDD